MSKLKEIIYKTPVRVVTKKTVRKETKDVTKLVLIAITVQVDGVRAYLETMPEGIVLWDVFPEAGITMDSIEARIKEVIEDK